MAAPIYNKYRAAFQLAKSSAVLVSREDYETCIRQLTLNLEDATLPPYHRIANCLIMVDALDNWEEAKDYLEAADRTWCAAQQRAEKENDQASIAELTRLRRTIDKFMMYQEEENVEASSTDEDCCFIVISNEPLPEELEPDEEDVMDGD